jgi:hypothetical protein
MPSSDSVQATGVNRRAADSPQAAAAPTTIDLDQEPNLHQRWEDTDNDDGGARDPDRGRSGVSYSWPLCDTNVQGEEFRLHAESMRAALAAFSVTLPAETICAACGESPATSVCLTCTQPSRLALCQACDQRLHAHSIHGTGQSLCT